MSPAESSAAMPWLSILMPCHNPGPFLAEALQSLAAQNAGLQGVELCCVDDGSTDGSTQLLQEWAANGLPGQYGGLARVRVLRHDTARGVSAARNALLQMARGRWLWFLDADDRLKPDALGAVATEIQTHRDLQLLLVDHSVLRARPRWRHRLRGEGHRRTHRWPPGSAPAAAEGLPSVLQAAQWHPWGRVVLRSSWPHTLRFPEGRVFEDLSVIPRLTVALWSAPGAVRGLSRPLVEYRSNPQSILGRIGPAQLHDWAAALVDLAAERAADVTPDVGAPALPGSPPGALPARPGALPPALALLWRRHLVQQWLRLRRLAARLSIPETAVALWAAELAHADPLLAPQVARWHAQRLLLPRWWGRWPALQELQRLLQQAQGRERS